VLIREPLAIWAFEIRCAACAARLSCGRLLAPGPIPLTRFTLGLLIVGTLD